MGHDGKLVEVGLVNQSIQRRKRVGIFKNRGDFLIGEGAIPHAHIVKNSLYGECPIRPLAEAQNPSAGFAGEVDGFLPQQSSICIDSHGRAVVGEHDMVPFSGHIQIRRAFADEMDVILAIGVNAHDGTEFSPSAQHNPEVAVSVFVVVFSENSPCFRLLALVAQEPALGGEGGGVDARSVGYFQRASPNRVGAALAPRGESVPIIKVRLEIQ